MPRTAIGTLALLLTGLLLAAPARGRPLHRWMSYHVHHGAQLRGTAPSIVPSNRPNEIHPTDRREAKTPDAPRDTDGNAVSGKQAISSGRGAKQNAANGDRQGGKGKEEVSVMRPNGLPASGVRLDSPGPIDVSITVEGRDIVGGRQAHPGPTTKFRLTIPGTTRVVYSRVPSKGQHPVRNAIGVRVETFGGPRPGIAAEDLQSVAMHAAGWPAARTIGLPAKPSGRDDHPQLVRPGVGPGTLPPLIGRTAVGGTGLGRRSFIPASVGGPPRMVVGISGSMFRPKR